jgi:hypothetical protein
LENDYQEEIEKLKKQSVENVRRRHNYLPFISALLNAMADKRTLNSTKK